MVVQQLLQWKNNKCYILWVCVCSLKYPAEMRMRCIVICGVSGSTMIFSPHYLINDKIFERKLHYIKRVFYFYRKISSNISYSLKNWARKEQKCILVFMWSTLYPSLFLTKFSRYIFEKHEKRSWKSVHWKPSCSIWTEGRTDRHDEANIHFSKFFEHS